MLPSTSERVPLHTADHVNRRIRRHTWEAVEKASLGGLPAVDQRLAELEREWDIERTLEANAASVALVGCVLGAFVDRRFYVMPALVGAFLLQHALQGWCPPLPLFRRMGVRTAAEIEDERRALRAVRADLATSRSVVGSGYVR
ncbi:DUF2892 domain-containing protein [Azoarcus olearius]|uniref:DUF2892 domain-containing protein n=1 Tax=Azoarcus sp. (strain BH72) TaxID=418699 RepID=A1K686_AZOSB|nr:DUF2892 domain-containing protein [Azoarcus olearius]ANQ84912.1 hypothetical protein dqs_1874 [Azoarcus olearius]CAL94341.1 conserved hypothetical protein [Azoarcus olearius]